MRLCKNLAVHWLFNRLNITINSDSMSRCWNHLHECRTLIFSSASESLPAKVTLALSSSSLGETYLCQLLSHIRVSSFWRDHNKPVHESFILPTYPFLYHSKLCNVALMSIKGDTELCFALQEFGVLCALLNLANIKLMELVWWLRKGAVHWFSPSALRSVLVVLLWGAWGPGSRRAVGGHEGGWRAGFRGLLCGRCPWDCWTVLWVLCGRNRLEWVPRGPVPICFACVCLLAA